ncbi:hypothetical protein DERF_000555 [Dermatophagoides farinae]|uniref:Uncharacterized protein n=1 Tax=Dermatophagoides farinae TaxID=6954 RepID=A0A922I7M4_DERFA|nr:hypothetical protein DERF_000555 [Dermatophagoides farinae]
MDDDDNTNLVIFNVPCAHTFRGRKRSSLNTPVTLPLLPQSPLLSLLLIINSFDSLFIIDDDDGDEQSIRFPFEGNEPPTTPG